MVLGAVSILVVVFLVTTVIPSFVSMLGDKTALPLPTKIVMGLSNFMVTKWYLLILSIVGIVGGIIAYKNSDSGRLQLDGMLLKLPIYGKIYNKIITSRFARTFGILMGSGVPLIQSFSICANVVGNAVIKELLDHTADAVKKGAGIGDTLASKGIFPLMLTQMIKIGEESGTLDEVLEKTSDFYDTEVDTATAQLTTMIEPVIIVVLGLVVGFIIISIMLPMFSMFDQISNM
jgi:type IV pilus assembly protein PilC